MHSKKKNFLSLGPKVTLVHGTDAGWQVQKEEMTRLKLGMRGEVGHLVRLPADCCHSELTQLSLPSSPSDPCLRCQNQ